MPSPEKLCESVYLPPVSREGWRLESVLGIRECRYFSYGRRALAEALSAAGVQKGDIVSLPALICRELLSAVNAVGAVPSFYPVGIKLELDSSPGSLLPSKVIIAVNYFGFPQDLAPFREYCKRTGAILVEDNAHGLFSRDEQGRYLGTRGDMGIFSLRKTIPLPNGAALTVNTTDKGLILKPQVAFDSGPIPLTFRTKQAARRLVPIVGARVACRMISLGHRVRDWKTDVAILESCGLSETALPSPDAPSKLLSQPLRIGEPGKEAERRRGLYEWVQGLLLNTDISFRPLLESLPPYAVPYGYPFYAAPAERSRINEIMNRHGLMHVFWPELPGAVKGAAPQHYTQLSQVPFLW